MTANSKTYTPNINDTCVSLVRFTSGSINKLDTIIKYTLHWGMNVDQRLSRAASRTKTREQLTKNFPQNQLQIQPKPLSIFASLIISLAAHALSFLVASSVKRRKLTPGAF